MDDADYGQWLNTNIYVNSAQNVKYEIQGEVSLCRAYLPINNLQSSSDKDLDGAAIPIPRVEDKASVPVTVYFDAKTDEWRNLTQVFKDDLLVVSLLPDQKTDVTSTTMFNSIATLITADCTEGKQSYSPICGRYSIWGSGDTYVDRCTYIDHCRECHCHKECNGPSIDGQCPGGKVRVCDWCSCYQNNLGSAPEP